MARQKIGAGQFNGNSTKGAVTHKKTIGFSAEDFEVIKAFAQRRGLYQPAAVKNAFRIAYGLKFPGDGDKEIEFHEKCESLESKT